MKRLTLIRHAKSSHDNPAMRDFDRPLNSRGRRDAPAVGRHLDETHQFSPDRVISSPATRAIATARMIVRETGLHEWSIRQEERIYEASTGMLVTVVRELPDTCQHVAIFGHNPGLEDLTNWLCGCVAITEFRTAGVVFLELNIESWEETTSGVAVLKDYLFPAMIGAGKEAPRPDSE